MTSSFEAAGSRTFAPGDRLRETGGRRLRILVADDHEINRTQTAGMLATHGYVPVPVSSAEEAAAALASGDLDLALIDADLPDMPGLQVVTQAADAGASIPFILCTRSWNIDRVVEAMRDGVWDILNKPFSSRELLNKIARGLAAWDERRIRLQNFQRLATSGRLVTDAVRDLNNFLTIIHGYAQLLKSSLGAEPELAQFAAEIEHAAERAGTHTDRVLAVSLENGPGAGATFDIYSPRMPQTVPPADPVDVVVGNKP